MTLVIDLDCEERAFLLDFVRCGTRKARAVSRARALLLADEKKRVKAITEAVGLTRQGICLIKKRYLAVGVPECLVEKPRSGQPRKYSDTHKAEVIALACTDPPVGRSRWTVRLMVSDLQKKKGMEQINRETVRLILKNAGSNPGRSGCGASPK